ncbi:AraC family transcriptional regulator [Methylobacterium organophilum]|uniref:HTH araC/xylS-type domain-containing protein n=1 Tax=Methylobacterium organophilum TaxID=410 RepID=A0ABQ4T5J1_METOR|nr:AraC family transcriptional regulator [Methylobacterium organophilum]GJE25804.1 hypothetical protein LKMONMHP_0644 [Methylobacterium organophilum]
MSENKTFGLDHYGVGYYFHIDTLFHKSIKLNGYYGGLIRISFYLRESHKFNHLYGIQSMTCGEALVIKGKECVSLIAPQGMHIKGINFLIEPMALVDHYGLDPDWLPPSFKRHLFNPNSPTSAFKIALPQRSILSIEMLQKTDMTGKLKDNFFKSKVEELVCELVHALSVARGKPNLMSSYSKDQIMKQKIEIAADIFRQEIGNPPNIEEICRRSGLNKNLLNEGFKEIFGQSPGLYSRKIALEWARDQIKLGIYEIKTIALMADIRILVRSLKRTNLFLETSPQKTFRNSSKIII